MLEFKGKGGNQDNRAKSKSGFINKYLIISEKNLYYKGF